MENDLLASIKGISVDYEIPSAAGLFKKAYLRALYDITLEIRKGESWAIVGESGSGKSTLAMALLGLIDISIGAIDYSFDTKKISISPKKKVKGRMKLLWKKSAVVFQDPFSSLDPKMLVRDIIAEPFVGHRVGRKAEALKRISRLVSLVGLRSEQLGYFPDQLSGGLRQRVAIARALINEPEFVIFDEPTSSLDVSIQAQILNLIRSIHKSTEFTYLFITHNLMVARYISDHIVVMYLGNIFEKGKTLDTFNTPLHPYTKLLIGSIPLPEPDYKLKRPTMGKISTESSTTMPNGCVFHNRCPEATPYCGWTSEEVIEIITNELFGITGIGDIPVEITSQTSFRLEIIKEVESEMRNVLSKNSKFFKSVKEEGNSFYFSLYDPWKPKLIKVDDNREVKCILFDQDFKINK
ncbi:MAG: ABC transporter ATP-binding protein [Thermoplasmata archaeon]